MKYGIDVECGLCDWHGPESEMRCAFPDIPGLYERIDPGGEVPAGECPKCGGLCYFKIEDGTSGQDRKNYSDTQDRDNYTLEEL